MGIALLAAGVACGGPTALCACTYAPPYAAAVTGTLLRAGRPLAGGGPPVC